MNTPILACELGDIVYVRAWWAGETPVKCEVMGFDDDYIIVREYNGDPNRRWIDPSRIDLVLSKGTVV